MKKHIAILLLGFLAFSQAFSQEYKPRETWPFIYEEFKDGAARMRSGDLVSEAPFNVAVHDGSLMYVDGEGIIMRADMSKVYTAKVGDDVYVNVLGRMYRVLSELDLGNIVSGVEIDQEQQGKVSIGYGISSSTASAQGVSLLMDGRFFQGNRSLQQTSLDKYNGSVLPVKEVLYLMLGDRLIPATRQEILNVPGIDKKAAADFIKKEKIKWKDPASLEKLVIFVSSQLNND
jgi:hypothetical protein